MENNMKFFMAEKEAFDELNASETLGDIIRIGFNRVDFIDKDGKRFECWEMSGNNKVLGHRYEDGEYVDLELDGDTPIDQYSISIDRDDDQYTIVSVEELA